MMACTLSNTVASITSATITNLPKPSGSLHTLSNGVRLAKAVALASANGTQQGGEAQSKSLQQSRRPRDSSLLILDSWDPFSRGGLRQMMDTVDRLFLDDIAPARPKGGATRAVSSGGIRAPWDVTEDEEAFHIRVDMPGFGKEDVKVAVEDGVLVVSGQREEDPRWAAKSYSKLNTRLALPDNVQADKISAELKNGVLFVNVPKLKPTDRKLVFDVQVS